MSKMPLKCGAGTYGKSRSRPGNQGSGILGRWVKNMALSAYIPMRPDGRNQTGFAGVPEAFRMPVGTLPKACNKMRPYRSGTAPWRRIMCMKTRRGHRPMKTWPWG